MNKIVFEDCKLKSSNYCLDISEVTWKKMKKNKVFLIKIDFNNINIKKMKHIIRKILRLRIKTLKNKNVKNNLNNIVACIYNYNQENDNQKNIINSLNAIFKDNKKLMYEYIYNSSCDYLDSFFYGKNLCNFKDDKCGEKRGTTSVIGCCRHYENRILGPLWIGNKLIPCEHLKNKRCSAKCLPCKLFTCDYLVKKGIKFRIKDIFLIDTFFNIIQKCTLKIWLYTPRDVIIKKLLQLDTRYF